MCLPRYPLDWHQPRIPGFGDFDPGRYMAALYDIGYDGPACIDVEDSSFGSTLEGRKKAVKVAGKVLAPFLG